MVAVAVVTLTSRGGTMKKWEKKLKVHCGTCHKFVDEDLVQFINIEEDIQGVDVETFICPYCRKEHKSKIFG